MARQLIDVWDINTYDSDLLAELKCESDLICQYVRQDKENSRLRRLNTYNGLPLDNPHTYAFQQLTEQVIRPLMRERVIRGWHYTRLTDEEANLLQREGVYPSTLATVKRRLDMLAATGVLSASQAETLYAGSPFHHEEQTEARSNKFWMTSFPLPITYSGVTPLLESWGGESVYFWLKERSLKDAVSQIGMSRVIELAVPLKDTNHSYSAAKSVLAHYGRSLGYEPEGAEFEFYATQPLGPKAVLMIHNAGDPSFDALARGYPVGFASDAS